MALVFIAALASAGPAFADTTSDAAAKWGLLGMWRFNCAEPDGPGLPDYVYVVREGKLFLDRVFGTTTESNLVQSASITAEGALEVVVAFGEFHQVRQMTFIKQADGRMRILSNRDLADGEYTIRDGKFVASGQATKWASRCGSTGS